MATCKYCEKSGWFLRLNKFGTCKDCELVLAPKINRSVNIIEESFTIIEKSKKIDTKLSRLDLIENIVNEHLLPIERRGIPIAEKTSYQILDMVEEWHNKVILENLKENLSKAKDKAEKAKSAKSKINAYSKVLQKITGLKNKTSNPDIISNFESKVKQLLEEIQPNGFSDATKMIETQKIKKRELNQKKVTPEVIWQQSIDYYKEEQLRLEEILRDVESKKQRCLN